MEESDNKIKKKKKVGWKKNHETTWTWKKRKEKREKLAKKNVRGTLGGSC